MLKHSIEHAAWVSFCDNNERVLVCAIDNDNIKPLLDYVRFANTNRKISLVAIYDNSVLYEKISKNDIIDSLDSFLTKESYVWISKEDFLKCCKEEDSSLFKLFR